MEFFARIGKKKISQGKKKFVRLRNSLCSKKFSLIEEGNIISRSNFFYFLCVQKKVKERVKIFERFLSSAESYITSLFYFIASFSHCSCIIKDDKIKQIVTEKRCLPIFSFHKIYILLSCAHPRLLLQIEIIFVLYFIYCAYISLET